SNTRSQVVRLVIGRRIPPRLHQPERDELRAKQGQDPAGRSRRDRPTSFLRRRAWRGPVHGWEPIEAPKPLRPVEVTIDKRLALTPRHRALRTAVRRARNALPLSSVPPIATVCRGTAPHPRTRGGHAGRAGGRARRAARYPGGDSESQRRPAG